MNNNNNTTTWIYNIFNSLSEYILPSIIFDLIILIPSFILYLIELGLIFKFRKTIFDSSFFKLFAARTISSILVLIGQFIYLRFGRVGFFISFYLILPKIFLNIFYFIYVHFFYVEYLLTATLLLNRLTSLLWPLNYEKIWKKFWYQIIIFIFLIPLILTWNILFLEIYVLVNKNNITFGLYAPNDTNTLLTACWFSVFFTIFCFSINFGCLYVYKRIKINNNAQPESKQKMEKRLTIYSILTFFGQLLYSIYLIILYVSFIKKFGVSEDLAEAIFLTLYNQHSWVNDICTITIPAFLLFWACENIRLNVNKIIKFIYCFPKINNNNSIIVIPKQSINKTTTMVVVVEGNKLNSNRK